MTSNLKTKLLLGAATVALAFGGFAADAKAADQALGAVGGDTALTAGAANTIVERGSPADTDTGEFDASGGVTFGGAAVKAIDLDTNSGTVYIFDGTDNVVDNAAEDTATFDGDISIVSGKTLTIVLGDDEDSGTGAVSVNMDVSDGTNTDIFIAGSTASTRGGNLVIDTADNVATNIGTNTVTIDASMLLTTVTVKAGDAGGAAIGAAVTTTLGNAAADTINVTGLVNTGGAGSAGNAGGANNTTVTGTLTVGSGGIDINGGAGGAAGAGGASKVTVTPAVATLTGNTTIDGGAAGSTTGAGGAAELELTGGLTGGTGNFTLTGGIGASGAGMGDGGAATLDSDAAFTTTGTLAFTGGNGGAGSTAAANGGAALGEFAASLSTAGVTLTGGTGGSGAANVGGAATVTVATTSAIGSSGLTVTGGAGGTNAGAAVGGAASYTSTGLATITGAINVTGGAGNDNDAADGGAASATFSAGVTATSQTMTITGGAGDGDSNGDGGAATVTLADTSTFGAIVLDDGTANNATGGQATLLVDVAGTAETITGAITVGSDGEGTLTIENTSGATNAVTFANAIGTSAKRLEFLNIGNANDGGYATFSGEVHADAIDIDGQNDVSVATFNENVSVGATLLIDDGGTSAVTATFKKNLTGGAVTIEGSAAAATLAFSGTTAQTVTSTIAGVGAGEGLLVIGDDTNASNVTFSGVIGTGAGNDINTITVNGLATATFDANATADGNFTNDATATTKVGVGATVEANDFTDTGSYVLKAADANGTLAATDFGSLNSTGAGDTLTASRLTIDVTGQMVTGTVQLLTGITTGAATLVDDSLLYSFTVADNAGNTDVTVAKASIASFANTSNAGAGATLDSLGYGGDSTLDTIQNNIASASTQAELNEVLEATTSTVDGGNVIGGLTVANSTANVTSARLASLRDGTAGQTGMAAGNVSQGMSAWGQVFGTTGEQDVRDGVDGFDVDSVGFAAGVDTENLAEDWIVGLAFSYADTDVDSKNANATETEIDSYQVALYGDYDLDDRTYVAGQLGYIWSSNDTTRYNVGGTSGLTAKGDFDSDQIIARVEVGRDYMVGTETTLTPNVLVNYNHYDADSYTETGASGANLAVDSDALDVLEIGVGVDASWTYQQANGGYFKPEVSAGVRYDVIGDEVESTNTFTGGGTAFKTQGFDPAQTTMDLGAGVTYFTTDNWELSADYNYEFKSDYDSHSGLVKAAYKF